ncbi:interleukin 17a/f1 [Xyrichtys novacula]|uniref:Interleukin 17a/f1 n=1 Tax=Xyrichtys novacula TaxID=13765 RepID=A0AAV1EMX6_XYRNO|nr:interleukin 17a/f1 [Xyrichtys novacula]
MFSTLSSRVTVAVVAALMMMMMMTTEAMPKHSAKTHKKSHDGAALKTVPLQLDPSTFTHASNIRSLQNVSISPWTYNTTHDDSMYPPTLSEARCSLKGCLDSEGQEDQSLQSRPIMHQVLVLRRVRSPGSGDSYHYRLESRLIAVGCTCIRPIITPQN